MSLNQSNLSSPKYGYDVVVATTQESINSFLDSYFYEASQDGTQPPMVTKYYGMDQTGKTYEMTEENVLSQTGKVDPFKVDAWDGTGTMPAGVAALNNSDFYYGFQAQLGLPPGVDTLPDIVTMKPGSQTVTYNMLCSKFTIVQCDFGRRGGIISYINSSQQSGEAWTFTSTIPLAQINDPSNLPAAVQNQINSMGGEFSVQKLYLDLDNAALESTPSISGVSEDSDVLAALTKDFLGEYFNALKTKGEAVLNYSITVPVADPSTLNITQVDLFADAFTGSDGEPIKEPTQDQKDLSTLNYLCSTNGDAMSSPTQFSWNWLDNDTEAQNYHGIIAVNRNTLANFFENQLEGFIAKNCYTPSVTVTPGPAFSWNMFPCQTPTATKNPTGATVLSYSYSSSSTDGTGANDCIGEMTLTCNMNATVVFSGNTIVITQHLVIYIYAFSWGSSADGNIVDKTITDTYTLTASDDGKMLMKLDTSSSDISQTPSVNGFLNFFTGVNDLINSVKDWLNGFIPTAFEDIPIAGLQTFVFPGGNIFSFKDVNFSDNQDLVTHITYVDAG